MQLFIFRNMRHSAYRLAVVAMNEDDAKEKMAHYIDCATFAETDFILHEVAGKLNSEVFSLR